MRCATDEMFTFERLYHKRGFSHVLGIDEVGRGALIGPVVAAGVIFPKGIRKLPDVRDSKMLTHAQRLELKTAILAVKNVAFCVVEIDSKTIDRMNIFQATMIAMQQVAQILPQADFALIDGHKIPKPFPLEAEALVGGDHRSASIAAASILAKVHRDHLMSLLSEKHPEYAFDVHKGYATEIHLKALEQFGVLPEHRRSFSPIKQMVNPMVQDDLF